MVAMVASACGGGETAVTPDFVLEMSPIELVMRQGETGQGIASLRRIGGFNGTVSVVPVTLPEHVTMSAVEFNGFETSLFFTVTGGANALISGYPITVRATASDGRVQTAKFFISLLQAPPPSIHLVLSGSLVTVVAGRTPCCPSRLCAVARSSIR